MLILHRQIKPHIHICPWMYRQQPDSWPCGNLVWWKWICNVSSVIKWCWLRQWKWICNASNCHWKILKLKQCPYPGELTIRSKKPLMQWISRLETAKCKFIWYWFLGFAYPWSAHEGPINSVPLIPVLIHPSSVHPGMVSPFYILRVVPTGTLYQFAYFLFNNVHIILFIDSLYLGLSWLFFSVKKPDQEKELSYRS